MSRASSSRSCWSPGRWHANDQEQPQRIGSRFRYQSLPIDRRYRSWVIAILRPSTREENTQSTLRFSSVKIKIPHTMIQESQWTPSINNISMIGKEVTDDISHHEKLACSDICPSPAAAARIISRWMSSVGLGICALGSRDSFVVMVSISGHPISRPPTGPLELMWLEFEVQFIPNPRILLTRGAWQSWYWSCGEWVLSLRSLV